MCGQYVIYDTQKLLAALRELSWYPGGSSEKNPLLHIFNKFFVRRCKLSEKHTLLKSDESLSSIIKRKVTGTINI